MALINVTKNDISEETKKQKQNVINKIKNMDAFMSYTPNPEVKEYTSDVQYLRQKESNPDVLKDKAEENLVRYKQVEEAKINQKADRDIAKLDSKEQEVQQSFDNKAKAKEASYDALKENKAQKFASQGLGRSSIKDQGLESVEEEKQAVLTALQAEAEKELADLQNKKAELEVERDNSLASFDIQYAIKLQDKIDKLSKEVQDYNNKVQKYNNKLTLENEKRASEYAKQIQKDIEKNENRNRELTQFLTKYGYGNYAVYAQNQKVQLIKEFLNALDKQTALEVMLEDDSLKDAIGESAFNTLIQQIQERVD